MIMPDTPGNQAAYPQPSSQAPGLGFPIARLLVVFSLAVGTVLEAAMGPYQGKQTSELALLRLVLDQFRPGDIVLADRFFCSYWVIAALQARGVDVVVRLHQRRTADFRRGRSAGPGGPRRHLDEARAGPRLDEPRRVRGDAAVAGGPRAPGAGPGQDQAGPRAGDRHDADGCADLPGRRSWGACSASGGTRNWICGRLKTEMQMEMLRTKSPEMVRKEVAAHLLAYNLIRGIMAEAARVEGIEPRRLSFKGSLHTVREFEAAHLYDPERIERDLPRLVALIGQEAGGRSSGPVRAAGGEAAAEAASAAADAPPEGQGLDQTRDHTLRESEIACDCDRRDATHSGAMSLELSSCHSGPTLSASKTEDPSAEQPAGNRRIMSGPDRIA